MKKYTRYVVLEQHGPKLKKRTFVEKKVLVTYHGHHTLVGFAKTRAEALNLQMRARQDGGHET